jgi:hypothetical protein
VKSWGIPQDCKLVSTYPLASVWQGYGGRTEYCRGGQHMRGHGEDRRNMGTGSAGKAGWRHIQRLWAGLFLVLLWRAAAPAQMPGFVLYVNNTDATCDGHSPCFSTIQAAPAKMIVSSSKRLLKRRWGVWSLPGRQHRVAAVRPCVSSIANSLPCGA